MDKIYIGYVQGVHGLRGDLKVKCRFESPEKVFKSGNKIYLNEEVHEVTNAKLYKGFYLVTIDNIKDINAVIKYKGYDVYFEKSDLNLKSDEYILDDLYGLTITSSGKTYGTVKEILDNGSYKILVIDYSKSYMIPLIPEYIKRVDLESKTIEVENAKGLIL
jgi:16S rRNA processing protein RimM